MVVGVVVRGCVAGLFCFCGYFKVVLQYCSTSGYPVAENDIAGL